MRIKLVTILGLVVVLMGLATPVVSAHVLIADTTNSAGAILHITPDDDPVAGETAGIYYEVETDQDLARAAIHLQIQDQTGGIDESVVMSGKGKTAAGAFVFPLRGLYEITLTIGRKVNGPEVKPLKFVYSVRVTKSVDGQDPKPVVPAWAIFGMLISVWTVLVALLVAWVRRKSISAHSK